MPDLPTATQPPLRMSCLLPSSSRQAQIGGTWRKHDGDKKFVQKNIKMPPWSRGKVPTSWPEWRGFKPGGGRRIFKDGKIQGTSPPGGILSRLTCVVDLLHVKEPQAPKGPLSKIADISRPHIVVNSSARAMVRRSLVGEASGAITARGHGGWFEIHRGRTIDHIEVAVHGETRPWT
jgi:hypothetical protein